MEQVAVSKFCYFIDYASLSLVTFSVSFCDHSTGHLVYETQTVKGQ